MVNEHLSGYQARDREVVDYEMYELADTGLSFRGPPPGPLEPNQFFSCIGAAQSFGCFCEHPFAHQVSQKIDLPVLNLGYGGAGPAFFLRHAEKLLPLVNKSRFVIVQVMSGRSASNSMFDAGGLEYVTRRRDGRKMSAQDAWRHVFEFGYLWSKSPVLKEPLRRICQNFGRNKARKLLVETREDWCRGYEQLLPQIKVPKILFWISKRSPDLVDDFEHMQKLFGIFPHFVNREMLERIRPLCDDYVESISDRGSPQPLVSRFTGQPCTINLSDDRAGFGDIVWTHNPYYPSPEMHDDAATRLLESKLVNAVTST